MERKVENESLYTMFFLQLNLVNNSLIKNEKEISEKVIARGLCGQVDEEMAERIGGKKEGVG